MSMAEGGKDDVIENRDALPAAPAGGDEAREPVERFLFTPPIDIYETEEGLVLHADLPGVSIKTLDLQVQDNKLTLFGRVGQSAPEGARPVHQEYAVGDYLRSFILSDEVDYERISATMSNGVLKVVLPKSAKAKPRRIDVRTEPTQ
jgi:HSP20 family molecular chaperone IbpA